MKKWILTLGLLLTAALVMAGCGGKKSEPASSPAASQAAGGGKTITVDAKNFEFDQKEIKVKKGETVTITLKNSQGNHGLKIEGYDKEVKGNESVTFTADQAGEFKFECSIMCGAGHKDMVGTLIVEG
ncbi:cytochrome C oxidase subunit II [Cohnella pontilimi]|uniref:Cytochrome C oxidase subunit II n=1 Tax=Cohnella pontilimi TaxID=2564100 RepID=A0A4U0FAG3_9BACL|nr:cupredoxin domain-containing protein [Cohnella pontilimi]TJY41134.1 cytochrome C oxidase subunit II [Cohnella pontilimi]